VVLCTPYIPALSARLSQESALVRVTWSGLMETCSVVLPSISYLGRFFLLFYVRGLVDGYTDTAFVKIDLNRRPYWSPLVISVELLFIMPGI
jgi:hypothetical protein